MRYAVSEYAPSAKGLCLEEWVKKHNQKITKSSYGVLVSYADKSQVSELWAVSDYEIRYVFPKHVYLAPR